jgi:hypothetical protein
LGFNAKAVETYWSKYGRYPDFKENNLFSANSFNNYLFSLLTVQQQWKLVPNTLECRGHGSISKVEGHWPKGALFVYDQNQTMLCRSQAERKFCKSL